MAKANAAVLPITMKGAANDKLLPSTLFRFYKLAGS
jgi:hypothetical protein